MVLVRVLGAQWAAPLTVASTAAWVFSSLSLGVT
jgi:hypothetical protein